MSNKSENTPESRKIHRNPYRSLGLILTLAGALLAPVFYFLAASVPLTALALSAIILGLVSATLAGARPDITPEASRMMLQTGMENIASLLEELGLTSRAVYLPSPEKGGRPRAVIPLKEDGFAPDVDLVVPGRLITRFGPNLENMCLSVVTPGSISLDGISLARGGGTVEVENALSRILVGIMDLADAVSIHAGEKQLLVDVVNPKLNYDNVWYCRSLGSPVASIVAAVASQGLSRPLRINSEKLAGKTVRIELEIL